MEGTTISSVESTKKVPKFRFATSLHLQPANCASLDLQSSETLSLSL
jgi:hypothetical protein